MTIYISDYVSGLFELNRTLVWTFYCLDWNFNKLHNYIL